MWLKFDDSPNLLGLLIRMLVAGLFAIGVFPSPLLAFNATKDVKFYMFAQKNPLVGQVIRPSAASVGKTNFNSSNPTRFLIHGWLGSIESWFYTRVKESYLKRGQFNIIAVDWSLGADSLIYLPAINNLFDVANVTANLIRVLVKNKLVNLKDLMIIGHSLGAHAAGLTGKILGGKLGTIIGLDPAGVFFDRSQPKSRLTPSDAKYIEVIHTNAGGLGYSELLGDADFFPNYGINPQPECSDDGCSHAIAYEYFAQSLSLDNRFNLVVECPFETTASNVKNRRCPTPTNESGIKMGGEPPNSNLKGVFYLKTADAARN